MASIGAAILTSTNTTTLMTATTSRVQEKELVIEYLGDYSDKLFRINKKTGLTLKPGPKCLIPSEARFKTNYPLRKGSKFVRSKYYELNMLADHQDLISSSFNWKLRLEFEFSGTFHIACYKSSNLNELNADCNGYANGNGKPAKTNSKGELREDLNELILWQAYVIVEPEMKVPLNAIRCQTVLSKCLGPLSSWRQRLTMVKELRYNMIHFTPIQELGQSESSYSLRDQLKLNPLFGATLNDVRKEIEYMDKKWSIMSVTDIVLNHTANDSPWIREHPECAFNMSNSSHLRPAFLLDSAFIWIMQDLMSGYLLQTDGLSAKDISNEISVQKIAILLRSYYIPQLKLFEFFMINIADALARFKTIERGNELQIDYANYERYGALVKCIPSNIKSADELKSFLTEQNIKRKNEIRDQLNYALNNAINAIKYERLNPNGPYFKQPVDPTRPLVAPYFTHTPIEEFKIVQEERKMYSVEQGSLFMAHNGWVMGASAGNADCSSNINADIYFKRELIAWGDCIKLRYGSGPSDVPFLWDHMRKYVESQAKIFHGFRIDNCHSTPLHVAEFVVDIARSIRPDFYLMAELFTQSEQMDNLYVNRLGLSSLIRESMSANNSRELGRLMYRFGGTPVGAFLATGAEPLKPCVANAIFYDQTHDNESPIKKRSAYDLPATMAILNMASCATGSTRGYDELVPHYIDVVKEKRLYPSQVDENNALLPLRRFLNGTLQRELQGFSEIFVDQVNDDVIAITRHNPNEGTSIVLIARTSFNANQNQHSSSPIKPLTIEGQIARILIEAQAYGDPSQYVRNEQFINGLANFRIKIFNSQARPEEAKLTHVEQLNVSHCELTFNEFTFLPSSVLAVKISLAEHQVASLKFVNSWRIDPSHFSNLTLDDANFILFRCAEENSFEPYELPDFTRFTYSGLYGLMYYLERVRENQDQAHPLAVNLRLGNWLSDYIIRRLKSRKSTFNLAEHLDHALSHVYELPRGMVPKYFDFIINQVYEFVLNQVVYPSLSIFVSKGPKFVKLLALSSVALVGECPSAPLPAVDQSSKLGYLPSIAAGLPHFSVGYMRNWGRDTFIAMRGLLLVTGRFVEAKSIILSCARTLKHGLIPNLIDGGVKSRYNCRDAVWWWLYCIREYTRMAPSGIEILRCKVRRLHKPERKSANSSSNARSSSRANLMQANGLSNGHSDSTSDAACISQYLFDVIQEALECHFKGMEFVEDNAGKQLDEHMTEKGFHVKYGTKQDTGFVFGGNRWNCGTWMDKMGSSLEANTQGLPASPRDGSAIELVALSKCIVSWLDEMSELGYYPYDKVERVYDNTITLEWTWKKWASLIQANFENYFYIPLEHEQQQQQQQANLQFELNSKLINRRGIYKDTLGASIEWQDYQFRPNFLIALVVAPELFDPNHAKNALKLAKDCLCGPLGMKTLDPTDWNYCGDYDNDNRSSDPKVSHGYNYHQGPEWLWLTGYYIRASSKFLGVAERSHHLQLLTNIYGVLIDTPWLGLPELTNSDGKFCKFSCPTQAWSLGTTLEALQESVRKS